MFVFSSRSYKYIHLLRGFRMTTVLKVFDGRVKRNPWRCSQPSTQPHTVFFGRSTKNPLLVLCAFLLLLTFSGSAFSLDEDAIEGLSVEEMVGQMIFVGFRGADPDIDAQLLKDIRTGVRTGRVGGVILFDKDAVSGSSSRNITSVEQVCSLTTMLQQEAKAAPLGLPLFIAVDQEGGKVQRIKPQHGMKQYPSAEEMGRSSSFFTAFIGLDMGIHLRLAGINLNFAPVVDVNINLQCPVIGKLGRSFSSDPLTTARHGAAFAKGLLAARVIPTFKHFPGHGSSTEDSHKGFTDITETWSEAELLPYRELLVGNPSAMVMVGHVAHRNMDDFLPASVSAGVITGLLRGKLGWQGVVITDDLDMKGITDIFSLRESILLAVNAGADILLFGNNLSHDTLLHDKIYAEFMALIKEKAISETRVRQSFTRIVTLKKLL